MMKILGILFVLMSLSALFAENGSCFIRKGGQCIELQNSETQEEIQRLCSQFSGLSYQKEKCVEKEIAGKCSVASAAGKMLRTFYYYPVWTRNAAKINCIKMKGSFTD